MLMRAVLIWCALLLIASINGIRSVRLFSSRGSATSLGVPSAPSHSPSSSSF